MGKIRNLLCGAGLLAGCSAVAQSADAKCAGLAGVELGSGKVTSATLVAAGGKVDGVRLPPAVTAKLPAFCRVQVTDKPSDDSDIKIEVWLPAEGWNGRFRGTGNGGFAGSIYFSEMAGAVAEGFAAAGTDTGHVGGEPVFALGHPEKVKDFGWRAVHDMTVESKALVVAYYGKPQTKAYFASCSDGGREALMEAQRFPADYDGILAGAPAWNWTGLVTGGAELMSRLEVSPLPAAKIPAIAAGVRAACDAQDGVKDGVVNDPRSCGFDPATLVCKEGAGADCLTVGEAATVKNLYAGAKDGAGKELTPGLLPGGEEGGNGWSSWITGTERAKSQGVFFGEGFFRNFVYGDPAWTLKSFSVDKDLAAAREKTGAAVDARDMNLKAFTGHGGKLILYHGWNDPGIPAKLTIEYFDGLGQTMGAAATDAAVRLYMVAGMQHCGGGPGATEFGASGGSGSGDAEHDVFTALEQWVEVGKAPGTIVAVRHGADGFTRPLCVYPAVAKYVKGDTTDAKSFVCVR